MYYYCWGCDYSFSSTTNVCPNCGRLLHEQEPNMTDKDALINHSKCKDCEHLISRIVIPTDFEEFGITMEELQEALDDDDYSEENQDIVSN